jgi:23S rRNA pseudouridine955/2504/2580 synthase
MTEEIVVAADEVPKKLENFLKKRFRVGYVSRLFRKSGIRLNGKHPKPDDIVRGGDRILFYIPFETKVAPREPLSVAANMKLIFEDDALLVIDKPPALAVHEGKTVAKRDSVLGILESRYRGKGVSPKLVHRLDKDNTRQRLVARMRRSLKSWKVASSRAASARNTFACWPAGYPKTKASSIPRYRAGGQRGAGDDPIQSRNTIFRYDPRAGADRYRTHASDPASLRQTWLSGRHGRSAWNFFNKRFRKEMVSNASSCTLRH